MIALDEIRRLTLTEKLLVMETLWDDLSRQDEQIDVPQWHKEVLEEREDLIQQGKAKFIDWETAKDEIRKSVS